MRHAVLLLLGVQPSIPIVSSCCSRPAGGHRRIARASVDTVLAQQQAVIETVSGLKIMNVVLIDDNPAQLELYRLKLEHSNQPLLLTMADNGYRGLLAVGQINPDFVIASLDLRGINAGRLIEAVAERLPHAGIIALSTNRDDLDWTVTTALPSTITILNPVKELDSIGALLSKRQKR